VLMDCVASPAKFMSGLTAGKWDDATATPDQVAVARFVRRQAIKALAQVRFAVIPGPDGKTPLYPSVVLARVAAGYPAYKIGRPDGPRRFHRQARHRGQHRQRRSAEQAGRDPRETEPAHEAVRRPERDEHRPGRRPEVTRRTDHTDRHRAARPRPGGFHEASS